MRVNIRSCLLAFVLGCNVTAGIIHEIVEEKTQVTLRCPHSVEGYVTWSRERNGDKTDILTVNGDRLIKHIDDPGRRYSSLADKSLFIVKVVVSDSGRYFCNNEAAADLTVIPSGNKAPPTTTTRTNPTTLTTTTPTTTPTTATTAALPPTEAVTTVPSTPPLTDKDKTTTEKHRNNKKKGKKTTTTTTRRNPTTLTTATTGNTTGKTSTNAETPFPWQMCVRTVIGILYLIIMISITVTTWRKARQTEATHIRNRK
ncbi:cell wall protein DAN4-like isoform X1 [Sander lucioperca]|uniref:cell wall protein DAN4-like isoform X1 n=1 Tax=Sander lucioperca TaxID=283035 RepID=UPI001653BDD7|nr:cell wall protein DAN4-like isoform X1 [Sander lucioperca]